MKPKQSLILYKTSTYSLVASLALVFFSFIAGSISFLGSLILVASGLKERVLEFEANERLAFGAVSTLVIMSLSLFWANSFLNPRMKEVEESVGRVLLSVLASILSILLLVLFYFSFSYFFSYLSTRFWS